VHVNELQTANSYSTTLCEKMKAFIIKCITRILDLFKTYLYFTIRTSESSWKVCLYSFNIILYLISKSIG